MKNRVCYLVPAVLALAPLVACGGAQPEPAAVPDTPAAPAEPAAVGAPAEPAQPAAEQPPPQGPTEPYAEVVEILPGRDDPQDRRARIELFNPTTQTCIFKSYTLVWGDSSKEMPLGDVQIPAGNSRQRFLIVHPNDGDIDSLSAESASVELQVECGP